MHKRQWLEGLPSIWVPAPAWSVFDERGERSTPDAVHLTPSQAYGVVPQAEYMETTGNRVVLNLTGQDNMKAVSPGDFIIHLRSFQGGLEASSLEGKVSAAYTVLKPACDMNITYYQHLLKSKAFVDELANLTFQLRDGQTVNYARFARMALPVPPSDVQQRIADYLDRETGEIDAMIAKMDELAETLESRRIESITSAVSGANSADRIPTGNVWFPSVPRGWRTSSVQLLSARLTDGAHVSPETENGEYDFVSTRDVRHGVIDFEGSLKTSASSYEYLVRTGCRPSDGDILFSKDGTVGETAIVEGAPEFVVASSLIIVTPTRSVVTPEFLRYALESGPAQRAARSYTRGSGLPRISVVNFGRGVVVPVPPTLDEQKSIADHLDEVTGKIDAMLAKVAELKSLLTERRAALITDVVTGRKEVA